MSFAVGKASKESADNPKQSLKEEKFPEGATDSAFGRYQGGNVFGKSASEFLTFEHQDSAKGSAHDLTFNMNLIKQGIEKSIDPTQTKESKK